MYCTKFLKKSPFSSSLLPVINSSLGGNKFKQISELPVKFISSTSIGNPIFFPPCFYYFLWSTCSWVLSLTGTYTSVTTLTMPVSQRILDILLGMKDELLFFSLNVTLRIKYQFNVSKLKLKIDCISNGGKILLIASWHWVI